MTSPDATFDGSDGLAFPGVGTGAAAFGGAPGAGAGDFDGEIDGGGVFFTGAASTTGAGFGRGTEERSTAAVADADAVATGREDSIARTLLKENFVNKRHSASGFLRVFWLCWRLPSGSNVLRHNLHHHRSKVHFLPILDSNLLQEFCTSLNRTNLSKKKKNNKIK